VSNDNPATESAPVMEIEVNGERRRVPEDATLAVILHFLGLPADRVAVELDRQIVRKTDWETRRVEPGAQLEVVHFVGGGCDIGSRQPHPNQ
jgi:sulfur carrier protein